MAAQPLGEAQDKALEAQDKALKVTLVPYSLANIDAYGRPIGGSHRSKGTHLSDVIRYIGEKLALNRYSDNQLYAQSGFVFEAGWRAYAGNRGKVIQTPEMAVEGIHMNLDGVCLNDDDGGDDGGDGGAVLEEYKATWRSVGGLVDLAGGEKPFSLDKYKDMCWDWDIQTKGYCYAIGVNRARVIPLFVNGDYKPPAPMLGVYGRILEFEYTGKELAANWRMVVKEARELEREGWTRG